jgi:surfactin synthase thioesterase subunit
LAAEPLLDCLITAMHGREDRSAQQELIDEGRCQSAAEFSFAEFEGEPFFTNTARTEVLAPVRRTLVG